MYVRAYAICIYGNTCAWARKYKSFQCQSIFIVLYLHKYCSNFKLDRTYLYNNFTENWLSIYWNEWDNYFCDLYVLCSFGFWSVNYFYGLTKGWCSSNIDKASAKSISMLFFWCDCWINLEQYWLKFHSLRLSITYKWCTKCSRRYVE